MKNILVLILLLTSPCHAWWQSAPEEHDPAGTYKALLQQQVDDSDNPDVCYNLGIAAQAQKQYGDADRHFSLATELYDREDSGLLQSYFSWADGAAHQLLDVMLNNKNVTGDLLDTAIDHAHRASERYGNVLVLDQDDVDASERKKIIDKLKQILEQKKQQEKQKQEEEKQQNDQNKDQNQQNQDQQQQQQSNDQQQGGGQEGGQGQQDQQKSDDQQQQKNQGDGSKEQQSSSQNEQSKSNDEQKGEQGQGDQKKSQQQEQSSNQQGQEQQQGGAEQGPEKQSESQAGGADQQDEQGAGASHDELSGAEQKGEEQAAGAAELGEEAAGTQGSEQQAYAASKEPGKDMAARRALVLLDKLQKQEAELQKQLLQKKSKQQESQYKGYNQW